MGYIRLNEALSTFMYIVCSITVGRKDRSICRICLCSNMSDLLLILLPKGYITSNILPGSRQFFLVIASC